MGRAGGRLGCKGLRAARAEGPPGCPSPARSRVTFASGRRGGGGYRSQRPSYKEARAGAGG